MADAAYQALMHQKVHQAIVISGESGAGKTESANLLLKQLVFLSKVCSLFLSLSTLFVQVRPDISLNAYTKYYLRLFFYRRRIKTWKRESFKSIRLWRLLGTLERALTPTALGLANIWICQ